jgi:hypothetical protein
MRIYIELLHPLLSGAARVGIGDPQIPHRLASLSSPSPLTAAATTESLNVTRCNMFSLTSLLYINLRASHNFILKAIF